MIYVFDLDGTLCDTPAMNYHDATPFEDRIARVNRLYDDGHRILIDTARGSVSGVDWDLLTRRQLADWGVKYHVLRTGMKLYGEVYVDDRAIRAEDFFTCES